MQHTPFHWLSGEPTGAYETSITSAYEIQKSSKRMRWQIRYVNVFSRYNQCNRRFPRSMRSQGERPGYGSHVKRVDTEMLSTHDVALRNVDGSLFHVQIWFVMGHQDQNGQNWRNISQFTMWLSQSSVNVYQTYQSLYQFQHFVAKCDSAMDKWCLPQ